MQIWYILLLAATVNANCIWYGIGDRSNPAKPKYNSYTGPGQPLSNATAFALLSKVCPRYALKENTPLCCDAEQVKFLSDSVSPARGLLSKCPACWANFRELLCAMTCHPNQADFLDPVVNNNLVDSIQYNLTELVANTFFNSCKDVQFIGFPAITFICESTPCTPELLLRGIGGSRSAFPILFRIMPTGDQSSKAFNNSFYPCNVAVLPRASDPGGPACSCTDCESSCTRPTPPPEEKPWPTVFGIDAWWVGSFFVLLILVVLFVTFEAVTHLYRKRNRGHLFDSAASEFQSARVGCLGRVQIHLEVYMCRAFTALGRVVSRYPVITLVISIAVSAVLSAGLAFFTVTTSPVELWSGPSSRSRLEKRHFDNSFTPFYRTEQLIIRPRNQSFFRHRALDSSSGDIFLGPALEKNFLTQVLALQQELQSIRAYSTEFKKNISLNDICFQPLAPDNLNCAVTSPLEYFQSDLEKFNFERVRFQVIVVADYLNHMMFCAKSPMSVSDSPLNSTYSCLGSSGMPIQPNLVFGGFNGTTYENATSVVVTFVVNNDPDPKSEHVRKTEIWEAAYLEHIKKWAKDHADLATVSYQAERSVEDEINRQSEADVSTVVLSYVVMFVYVSIFLASYRGCRTLFVDLRITLGLGGVIIVIISVVASVGMWSYIGTPATLIIIEVIPFLVLAVGVDNIFILVHDFELDESCCENLFRSDVQQSTQHNESSSEQLKAAQSRDQLSVELQPTVKNLVQARIARTLGRVGPSILLSSSAEAVAFFCGSLTSMPAVRAFALYAGLAIVFNFLLQIFAFVALLTLDARRRAANRFDVLCCLGLRDTGTEDRSGIGQQLNNAANELDSLSLNSNAWDNSHHPQGNQTDPHNSRTVPWLHRAIADYFTPFLLSGWVRPIVVVLSLTWACIAVAIIPHGLHIGLDQRLSMPDDSYMLDYFNALATDLRVGPPVYFVVTAGHKYDTIEGQNAVCGTVGCPESSLTGKISDAAKISTYTRIAQPASSWVDDYLDWIDPQDAPYCCRVYRNNSDFCPDTAPSEACETCPVRLVNRRPSPDDFRRYLPRFLEQNPGINCPKGGRAAYHVAVNFTSPGVIGPTYFMTYHTVLSEPDDYLTALRRARELADQVNKAWHENDTDYAPGRVLADDSVYVYSVFYVFYEQYLTVSTEAAIHIGVCLAAIAVVTFILLGLNIAATLMVLFGLLYIVLSMLALMVLWHIDLNAISLVNLVVTVGIGVEFCAHMVRAFTVSVEPTRLGRAKAALANMGSSILRGITLTKLGGIVVLAFSKSRLFQIFYFRMYLGIILFGAYTGIILLPVVLSYLGPSLNKALAQKRHMERAETATQGPSTTAL